MRECGGGDARVMNIFFIKIFINSIFIVLLEKELT
jgi:hypothetical protein